MAEDNAATRIATAATRPARTLTMTVTATVRLGAGATTATTTESKSRSKLVGVEEHGAVEFDVSCLAVFAA